MGERAIQAMRWIAILVIVLVLSDGVVVMAARVGSLIPTVADRLGSVVFYAVWIVVGAVHAAARWGQDPTPWRVRPGAWSRRDRIWIAAAILAGLAMYIGPAIRVVTEGATPPHLDFLGGAVMAPLVEEWLFRGVLWKELEQGAAGTRRALFANLVVGSLVFGFYHMSFEGYSWRSVGLAFGHAQFGLVMGILRWRSQSVLPGAVVHMVGNTIAKLAMY